MKITCLKENLKNGLMAAERVVGKSLSLPILNNLLLETDKGRLKISATNLEIGVNYWISGKIEKEGSITVPAKIISNFIGSLPNKKVDLELKDDVLSLKCENYRAKIKGQDSQDYPIIPKVEPQATVEIGSLDLKTALAQVAGMAALSEVRPEISGILFNFNKNSLKVAATDSFRLAEKSLFIKNDFEGKVILPQRTAFELIRTLGEAAFLEGEGSSVKMILGTGQVMFDLGHVQIVSRLIDGQYPDYQQIIPSSSRTKITVDKEGLVKAVKAASFFSGRINEVWLEVDPVKKEIEISSQSADVGENKSQLEAEIDGSKVKVSFNWRYLLDGINNIDDNEIFLGLNNESSAAILKPVGDESYLYVIMPIKAA